jgi:hypothetical protein
MEVHPWRGIMGAMDAVGPREIMRILGVTDALGFHREAVMVPLGTKGAGALRVTPGGKLEITAPAEGDFEAWLAGLPEALKAIDLSRVRRAE